MLLVRDDGPVRWLTLNRPDKRNALNPGLIAALTAALQEPPQDDGIRCLALTGAGKVFSAGADLAALRGMMDADEEENLADSRRLAQLLSAIQTHHLTAKPFSLDSALAETILRSTLTLYIGGTAPDAHLRTTGAPYGLQPHPAPVQGGSRQRGPERIGAFPQWIPQRKQLSRRQVR